MSRLNEQMIGRRDGGTSHELLRQSLLAARELTLEERATRVEHADWRTLTQDETDTLIRYELVVAAPSAERNDVRALVGTPRWLTLPLGWPADHRRKRARVQRGGIDSDPLVRLLAYRAWGIAAGGGSSCGGCGWRIVFP